MNWLIIEIIGVFTVLTTFNIIACRQAWKTGYALGELSAFISCIETMYGNEQETEKE